MTLETLLIKIFEREGIDYITSGKNVRSGNINIKCPFCMLSDPSYHCGISHEENQFFYCWRNPSHKGSISYLLKKVLGDDYKKYSEEISGLLHSRNYYDGTSSHSVRNIHPVSVPYRLSDIFCGTKHYSYLEKNRAFGSKTKRLIELFQLQRIEDYEHQYEIFIPYYEGDQLITYTLRTMSDSGIRYRTLDKKKSRYSSQETLLGYNIAEKGGKELYIVEGPFDCMKLAVLGEDFGISSVALSGKNITQRQIRLLKKLAEKFDRAYLTLDNDTDEERYSILSKIIRYIDDVTIKQLPDTVKDPGEMTKENFDKWRRHENFVCV